MIKFDKDEQRLQEKYLTYCLTYLSCEIQLISLSFDLTLQIFQEKGILHNLSLIYHVRFKRCHYILIKNKKNFRRNEFNIFFHMIITLAKKNVDKYFKKRAKISREIHDTFSQ